VSEIEVQHYIRMLSMRCMAPLTETRRHAACPGDVCECRCHDRPSTGYRLVSEPDQNTGGTR